MLIKLDELRNKIDTVDSEILNLLKRRLELALMTKRLKKQITDPPREAKVHERAQKKAASIGLLDPKFVEKIFALNIKESTRLQVENYQPIGFQGEYGSYSEIAALNYDPKLVPVAFTDFSDIFENVEHGYMEFGVVPVENTVGGAISQVNNLLIETKLKIIGEVNLLVRHSLMTLPGVDYKDIKNVYAHPRVLSQCRNFLGRNKLEGRPYDDSTGAAKMLVSQKPGSSAVIASSRTAQIYDLEIIKEGIEDSKDNYTRFVIISKAGNDPKNKSNNKCSVAFSLPDTAGALFDVLKLFTEAGINLTRIESMPRRDLPGSYYFLMDFIANASEPKTLKVLGSLEKRSTKYNFLGNYNAITIS